MRCASICAEHGMVQPPWLAAQFVYRHQLVELGMADDWSADEAFGRPIRSRAKRSALRARAVLAPLAYQHAFRQLTSDPRLTLPDIYAAAGAEVGKSADWAERECKRLAEEEPLRYPAISHLKACFAAGDSLDAAIEKWLRCSPTLVRYAAEAAAALAAAGKTTG